MCTNCKKCSLSDYSDQLLVVILLFQAIPAMLLALILCFDHRKTRDVVNIFDLKSSKGHKYIWYALTGYAIGLVAALAAGVLTHSPQPALLYLVIYLHLLNFLFLWSYIKSIYYTYIYVHNRYQHLHRNFVDSTFLVSIQSLS